MVRLRVVAAASLLTLAGCVSAGHPASGSGASPGGQQAPQLTFGQARQVFTAFLPGFARLPLSYSASAAGSLTTGAELQAQLFFKGQSGPAVTRLTDEVFYVPRLTSYPRWFWAAGRQRGSSPAGRLFVMVQSARSAPWKTATALYDFNSSAQMLHSIAASITTDPQGYAISVPLDDPSLDVRPSAMSATYASYLDGRTTRAVKRLFQPGPNTTYYISVDRQISRGAGLYGWRDTDHQSPARLPVYALRISTGGAIVIFSTYDTVGWAATRSSASLPAQPSGRAADYVPPAFILQDLGITSVRPGMRLTATAVDSVLAFVHPQGVGFIYVLINNGAATRVQESQAGG